MAAMFAATTTANAQQARPNIVFILADDLGWSDLGCYGADLHETPNIDRLAKQCVRFTNAYSAAPVCSPTRASIMTGKHPAKLHMTTWLENAENPAKNRKLLPPITKENLPHEEITIAEVLHDAGYHTAIIGKWHLGTAGFYPETQGFDINIGGTFWGAPPTYFYPYKAMQANGEFRYVPHLENGKPGEYLTDRLTDEALKVIDNAKGRPFFLYLAHHTVHTPIEAKKELAEKYEKKLKPEFHHKNAKYAAMTQSLDESVGRVLAKLDQLNLTKNTIVIFSSDNGGYIQQNITDNFPLRSGKGSLYEGGIRVPLMIRWPGVTPAGAVSNEPVVSADLYPTMLAMTGLPGDEKHNRDVYGKSLAPLLKQPAAKLDRDELYFHYPHYYPTTTPVSAIRARDWKLLEYFEDGHLELFNLKDDPSEKNNLAASMPDRAKELRARLSAWREQVGAQLPTVNKGA